MKKNYIIIWSTAICFIFYTIEQYTELPYLYTSISKIILFGAVSLGIYYLMNKRNPKELIIGKDKNTSYKLGILLSIVVFVAIGFGYFLFKGMIDFDDILNQITTGSLITKSNFPIVALYITFGNSFLEEVFFRGFIFLQLYKNGYTKLAYIFSSGLFAVYHVAIFKTWFNPIIILVALLGLFIGGLIFNYIDTKSKSIINSWLVHICADIPIMIIGMYMFYFS